MTLEDEYAIRCKTISDINEHLPTLRQFATGCRHVTELGVRSGNSTVALACGRPGLMVSYDINPMPLDLMYTLNTEIDFRFYQRNDLTIQLESTDLLFIDTIHTYTQLCQELSLHASAAQKYIIFHDTVTFGTVGMDGKQPGLLAAIRELLPANRWKKIRDDQNNNGLTVMERIAP